MAQSRIHQLRQFMAKVSWRPMLSQNQHMVPSRVNLPRKLGISKGDKIHYFAGFTGDWARALAQTNEVHYTDISKKMTERVRRTDPGKIASFKAIPGELKPQRPKIFDWSFSFEPYPMAWEAEKICK